MYSSSTDKNLVLFAHQKHLVLTEDEFLNWNASLMLSPACKCLGGLWNYGAMPRKYESIGKLGKYCSCDREEACLHALENQNWHGIYSWQTWGIVPPYVPPSPQINIALPILAKTVFTYSLLKAGKHSWPYYWMVSISEMSSHAPMARCRIGVPMATVMCPIWLPLLIGMHGRNDVTLVMQYKGSIPTMPWKLRRDI